MMYGKNKCLYLSNGRIPNFIGIIVKNIPNTNKKKQIIIYFLVHFLFIIYIKKYIILLLIDIRLSLYILYLDKYII